MRVIRASGTHPAAQLSLGFDEPDATETPPPGVSEQPPPSADASTAEAAEQSPIHAHPSPTSPEEWFEEIARCLEEGAGALACASQAADAYPADGSLVLLAAWAAIVENRPETSLRFLKRYTKRYLPTARSELCRAIALAQLQRWPQARALLRRYELETNVPFYLLPSGIYRRWVSVWLHAIWAWRPEKQPASHRAGAGPKSPGKVRGTVPTRTRADAQSGGDAVAKAAEPPAKTDAIALPPLPSVNPAVAVAVEPLDIDQFACVEGPGGTPSDFLVRHDLARLSLLRGYDELLCVPQLHHIYHYPYQIETARKVLKHFRGRVLLADEVGLGKTVEAGMVLKEYVLRGMVDRVLILTPPSLVGQWREEMLSKFGMEFATTHEATVRGNPDEFWSRPRIIASIATARMEHHVHALTKQRFDMVIVDEAHHLVNRASKNYKLVDGLATRFLLLLSATPVQNKLVELYNLLTLLKPGLFKTERDFRASYVTPGKPRTPLNRERLQLLMRDVMIRNTRALVNVALPPRQAITLRPEPSEVERSCYERLAAAAREVRAVAPPRHRLALSHLVQAAGSSPLACLMMVRRLAKTNPRGPWGPVRDAYEGLKTCAKASALMEILAKNREEKALIFVRFTETQRYLERLLGEGGFRFALFDGRMSGPHKDAAIQEFRERVPLLVSTESGGEGRNIQFCHTLINYDLPWNPQAIEQRIGRLHRIGQEHEVFVFNLATRGTVEERILEILDEKIGMFELVVGEIQAILGEMDDEKDFADVVFDAWAHQSAELRERAFDALTGRLLDARTRYEGTKRFDDELFGDQFEAL